MECEFPAENASDAEVEKILKNAKRVAVVGMSTKPEKDSHMVGVYLKAKGYEIIPVHPKADEIIGETCYPSLKDIPGKVDVVCLFRPPEQVPPFVDDAIEIGADTVWMQLGIVNNEAADKAREAGLNIVMNKCMKVEHSRMTA